MRRARQQRGQSLMRNALPVAKMLFGEIGFRFQIRFRITRRKYGGCGGAGARQVGDKPARRLRQALRQPAIGCRFFLQGQITEPNIHAAIKHRAG